MEYWKNLDLADIKYVDEDGVERIEEWRDVENYEGLYMVSDLGRFKCMAKYVDMGRFISLRKERIYNARVPNSDGYFTPILSHNKVKKSCQIHRLVALAFLDNPDDKPFVNHKDGIKIHNAVKNLEFSTCAENVQHAYDIGISKGQKGEKNACCKIKEADIVKIRKGDYGNDRYEISRKFKVHESTINNILARRTWTHI